MAPSIPDKIPCTTAAEFASQLRDLQGTLSLPETEDNWEKISRAIQKFAALARGGATKLDPEFVTAIKTNYKSITGSMLSERGRLSGVAIDFVSSFAPRLGSRFEPLVSVIIPALIKLLARPNKVFVSRAQTCLFLIIEHCHLPSIVPHLREAVKDKAQTMRLSATEATLQLLEFFDKSLLEVREGASTIYVRHRGNVEDIETIIKETARDANPTVRQVSRKVFEKYTELWPERVEAFTAPFSPTIRKYLNVNGNTTGSNGSKPVAALKVKPVTQAPQVEEYATAPTATAGPSRPVRPKPTQQATTEKFSSNPPSRPASRIDGHDPIPSASRSDAPSRTARHVSRSRDAVQPSEDRVAVRPASRAAVAREPQPAIASVTSRPASRSQHVGPTRSAEQVPTASVHVPPSRPAPITVKSAPSADYDGALSSASSASTFVRVQRPKPQPEPTKGPVRSTQGPVRAVSMKDPPLRPVRPQPVSFQDQEKLKPKARPLIDLRRRGTPPREDPPPVVPSAPSTSSSVGPRVSNAAAKVPLPESRPGSALDIASPVEPMESGPSRPVSVASSSTSSKPDPVRLETGIVSKRDAPDEKRSQDPVRPDGRNAFKTPAPLLSSGSSGPASNSTTKRPAVLNRRGAAPPPGQTQGFAPTRRRGGVTEPTLAQMARQKPAVRKPDVVNPPPAPAPKRTHEAAPTDKKLPSSLNVGKEAAPSRKPAAPSNPSTSAPKTTNSAPAPKNIPKDVVMATQVPLPPDEPHEMPMPSSSSKQDLVRKAPPSDATPRPSKVPRSTTPSASPTISKAELLVDLDQTIILAARPSPPNAPPQPPTMSNLMDFDVSVVLPDDFAPMPAMQTVTAFPVLRDEEVVRTTTPPISAKYLSSRMIKDPYESEGDHETRVALMEKEVNTL